MKLSPKAAYVLLAAGLVACTGTDVGNPEDGKAEVEVNLAGYDSQPRGALTLGNGYEIKSAWLGLHGFGVKRASDCGSAAAVGDDSTVVLDLIGQPRDYTPPYFETPAGRFCRFDMSFRQLDAAEVPSQAPPEMAGYSILVRGRRADGVEFVIRSTTGEHLPLAAANSAFRLPSGRQNVIVGFEINAWLNASRLDQIDGEDPIVVDIDHHRGVLESFESAVKTSTRLFDDVDGDGNLDADEFDDVLASGANGAGGSANANDARDAGLTEADAESDQGDQDAGDSQGSDHEDASDGEDAGN